MNSGELRHHADDHRKTESRAQVEHAPISSHDGLPHGLVLAPILLAPVADKLLRAVPSILHDSPNLADVDNVGVIQHPSGPRCQVYIGVHNPGFLLERALDARGARRARHPSHRQVH